MSKKNKSNIYFGDVEENAVIEYSKSTCDKVRNNLYNNILKEPFRKMVESISKRYPLYLGNYTIEEVQQYALSHLIEQMVKYNPDKVLDNGNKAKAYSYCQTIVRNYYKLHSKTAYKDLKTHIEYDSCLMELENSNDFKYEQDEHVDEYVELINIMVEKIRDVIDNDYTLKKNEIVVGEAIIDILENWNTLFLEDNVESDFYCKTSKKYTKSKILLLLKEQTRMTTKEIRDNIKPFSKLYFIEKDEIFD